MSETSDPERRGAWRRVLGELVAATDPLPDALAVGLGLGLGLAVMAAAATGGWPWAASAAVGLAVLVGRSAGVRPKAAGWSRPAAGTVVLVGLAGGLARVTLMGVGEGRGGTPVVVVGADELEAMRLDLGGAETTGADESTGGSTGDGESTGATRGSTSADGGDETTAEPTSTATTTSDEPVVAELECPSGMVPIEGTKSDDEFPGHRIEPFCLDITEVKVSSYERCMADGKCSEAGKEWGYEGDYQANDYCNRNNEGRGSHPINCVDWKQAKAFCAWAGKRLPTEWEWEWAARGRDEARTYPWGEEEPTCARAVMFERGLGCGKGRTSHVGSKPKGNSRDGVKDMAGNVWEWTSSQSRGVRVVRGGGWGFGDPDDFRASSRVSARPAYRGNDVGFRCARTAGGSK